MTARNNPFQLVYNTLWSMLEEDERFDVVKPGNRIKFNGNDREPQKTNTTTSDYPEVMLVSEGVTGNLCNSSSTSMLIRNYSWVVSSGDYRFDEIFPVEWAIYAGMLAWRYRLAPLLWEGEPFVTQANVRDSNFDQVDRQRRRGIQGWVAVWTIFVEMHFNTQNITGVHLTE